MTAQLQLALDDIAYDAAIALLHKVETDIDIVEVGTPLLMRYGMAIVTDLKKTCFATQRSWTQPGWKPTSRSTPGRTTSPSSR